jgi:hypothetical protein
MGLKNKKYIVNMSKGKVQIDEDEVQKLLKSLESGSVAIFRQGMVNPSFFVSVEPDEAKMDELREDLKYKIEEGSVTMFPLYEDLFQAVRENMQLNSGRQTYSIPVYKLPPQN